MKHSKWLARNSNYFPLPALTFAHLALAAAAILALEAADIFRRFLLPPIRPLLEGGVLQRVRIEDSSRSKVSICPLTATARLS